MALQFSAAEELRIQWISALPTVHSSGSAGVEAIGSCPSTAAIRSSPTFGSARGCRVQNSSFEPARRLSQSRSPRAGLRMCCRSGCHQDRIGLMSLRWFMDCLESCEVEKGARDFPVVLQPIRFTTTRYQAAAACRSSPPSSGLTESFHP